MSLSRYAVWSLLLVPVTTGCSRSRSGPSATPPATVTGALTSVEGEWVGALPLRSEFAVYSKTRTDIRDAASVKGAGAGSNVYVEIGVGAVVNGPVLSGQDVFLRERARVEGDVRAHTSVQVQNNVVVTGSTTQGAPATPLVFGMTPPVPGVQDVIVPPGGSRHLLPGAYRDVTVNAGASFTLDSGEYRIRRLMIEPDVTVTVAASDTAPTRLAISQEVRFADRIRMVGSGSTTPLSLQVETAQTSQVYLGRSTELFGTFFAPNAPVEVAPGSQIRGAIYGDAVTVQPAAVVCRPPSLLGLEHSEGAYAPAFDPSISRYSAVVPAGTTELTVTATATTGVSVSINGGPADGAIPLQEGTTRIDIALTGGECGGAHYELLVTRSDDYVLHVDDGSPALPAAQDGRSWATAFSSLEGALAAARSQGKEIHIAAGLYRPSALTNPADARSVSFVMGPGIELIGGYLGTEAPGAAPGGTPMDVVLSGDLNGNDPVSGWPALSAEQQALLSDNARHVITVRGNSSLVGPSLRAFTVRGGAADTAEDDVGGGLHSQYAPPSLESVLFERNYARTAGAALYAIGGPRAMSECLFEDNLVLAGVGAAAYIRDAKQLEIDRVVVQGNAATDGYAAGLYLSHSDVTVTNTLVVRNQASRAGVAIGVADGTVRLVNCTIADNQSTTGASTHAAGAYGSASVTIANSILWNEQVTTELDNIAGVTYSCVRGGAPGAGNIATEPSFAGPVPRGSDGLYGTHDDGFQLTSGSAGLDVADDSAAPAGDLALISRPWGTHADMGAYEYEEYGSQPGIFGRLEHGTFVSYPTVPVIDYIYDGKMIGLYAASTDARMMRIAVPKNKQTKDRQTGYLYLRGLDEFGAPLAGSVPVRIDMYRVGSDSTNLYFQSLTPTQGKRIVFVNSHWFQNVAHPKAYVVYAKAGAPIYIEVPLPQ